MNTLSKMNFTKAIYLIAFIVPTLMILQSSQIKKGSKELKLGKKAPLASMSMTGVGEQDMSLEELNGENGLIVVFSCNTCPFVVGSDNFDGWEVQYNDIYAKAKEYNLGMVLINSNEAKRAGDDSLEKMKTRSEEKAYEMAYLMDTDSKLADAFGAKTTPHVYLFDKDLKLVYKGSIDNSWDSQRTELTPYLYNAMSEINDGKSISEASTSPRGCSIKRTK